MRLGALFSVVVLDLIGFAVVLPVLPFFAETYGANATVLGLLFTVYAAMQFVCAPLWGRLSDRIGRRRVLLYTVAGNAAALVVLAFAQSLAGLFVGRLLSGLFAANISVASAYVADVTDDADRAAGMGLIGAAFGIGYVLGPALGGWLAPYGFHVPILAAAALNVLNLLQIWWRLPEPFARAGEARRVLKSGGAPLPPTPPISGQLGADIARTGVWSIPAVRTMVILNFLFVAGITQLESVLAFFLLDTFQYDARQVAFLMVFVALVMAAVQGGVVRRLRIPERVLAGIGAVLLAVSLLLMPWQHWLAPLLAVLAIGAIGRGLCHPAMLSLVSKGAPADAQGQVMGLYQSAASLARVVAPLAAGALYDWHHGAPFVMGAVLIAGVGFGVVRHQHYSSRLFKKVQMRGGQQMPD